MLRGIQIPGSGTAVPASVTVLGMEGVVSGPVARRLSPKRIAAPGLRRTPRF